MKGADDFRISEATVIEGAGVCARKIHAGAIRIMRIRKMRGSG
jgi:hypothetical protein